MKACKPVFELRSVAAFDVAQGGVAESENINHETGIECETGCWG